MCWGGRADKRGGEEKINYNKANKVSEGARESPAERGDGESEWGSCYVLNGCGKGLTRMTWRGRRG